MPQRRGGGGGGNNGNGGGGADSLLRRGLRELLDKVDRAAAAGGGVNGGGNGGGNRGSSRGREGPTGTGNRSGAAGAERRPQAGDWACGGCNFASNFARRRECFVCKRPRSPPRVGGRGAAAGNPSPVNRGPVGAWGNRPLLGGASSARGGKGAATKGGDVAPTFRVPGASVAARANATAASGGAGGGKGAGLGGAATPPATAEGSGTTGTIHGPRAGAIDEDGFQQVVRRGARRSEGARADEGAAVRDTSETPSGAREGRGSEGASDAAGEAGGGGDAGETPTPEELHQAWLHEVGLVRKLRQQGVQGGHPAFRAACEARDAAERAWRDSKDPAPASVRLGRAQAKLDRAVTMQAEARRAITDAERAHAEEMAKLHAAMGECTERVRMRRAQLREVQAEVGAGSNADGGGPQARAQQEAIRQVHQTIVGELGPTIAALVEQIDSSAPAWSALNGLLGKLSASKATLEGACTRRGTDHFDICGGDHGDDDGVCDAQSDWSESHDLRGQAWGDGRSGGRDVAGGEDHGEWTRRPHDGWGCTACDGDDADDYDQSMGTGDWWDDPGRRWGEGARWQPSGHGKWRRASWADQSEETPLGPEEDEAGPPPPARRRLEGAVSDQGGSTTHGGSPPASASVPADDPEEQKRRHAQRLDQIICMAVSAGVNPHTDEGEDLRMLDPRQLDEWVSAKLPSALLC